MKTSFFFRF
uniref:Uncharacterized protein n=1 Tax=Arundo donax TaxID=35708 RepID=A0A0A9FBP4_ARUDO